MHRTFFWGEKGGGKGGEGEGEGGGKGGEGGGGGGGGGKKGGGGGKGGEKDPMSIQKPTSLLILCLSMTYLTLTMAKGHYTETQFC